MKFVCGFSNNTTACPRRRYVGDMWGSPGAQNLAKTGEGWGLCFFKQKVGVDSEASTVGFFFLF